MEVAEEEERPLATAQLLLKQREEFRQAKEEMARLASELLEDAEANVCWFFVLHVPLFTPALARSSVCLCLCAPGCVRVCLSVPCVVAGMVASQAPTPPSFPLLSLLAPTTIALFCSGCIACARVDSYTHIHTNVRKT